MIAKSEVPLQGSIGGGSRYPEKFTLNYAAGKSAGKPGILGEPKAYTLVPGFFIARHGSARYKVAGERIGPDGTRG